MRKATPMLPPLTDPDGSLKRRFRQNIRRPERLVGQHKLLPLSLGEGLPGSKEKRGR
jgi:hypothetical protein